MLNDIVLGILPTLTALDAIKVNPIPRLFILYPPSHKNYIENNGPKPILQEFLSWIGGNFENTLYLHFICYYSKTIISPPLEIKVTKEWLKKVLPVLKVSFFLLKLVLKVEKPLDYLSTTTRTDLQLSLEQLDTLVAHFKVISNEDMDLGPEEVANENGLLGSLRGPSYDEIQELANAHPAWRNNMKQVRHSATSTTTVWVAKRIADRFEEIEY